VARSTASLLRVMVGKILLTGWHKKVLTSAGGSVKV
jgi:hypothetical protein